MKLTDRDVRIIRDVTLSHVLSRDQLMKLGYFSSVSRLNRRLSYLVGLGYLRVLETPFFTQRLYGPSVRSIDVVGPRIAPILRKHHETPRFLQHSLAVTDVRIALPGQGFSGWRFEAQLRQSFTWGGRVFEIRPDGLMSRNSTIYFLEVDLGHVSAPRFESKLLSFASYGESGTFKKAYGEKELRILTITTGSLRQSHLACRDQGNLSVPLQFMTFCDLGLRWPSSWS